MKRLLLLSAVTSLFVGCTTPDRTITDPAGAERPWGPANIESNYSAAPVTSSTDADKYFWKPAGVPAAPQSYQEWRRQ